MSALLYIPKASLEENDIKSLVSILTSNDKHRVDTHGGRRAAFKYLSHMQRIGIDLSKYIKPKDFDHFKKKVEKLEKTDFYRREFDESQSEVFQRYWELDLQSNRIHPIAKQARDLVKRSPKFSPQQLKLYFNKKQIDNIPFSSATFESSGFVDDDARTAMGQYPVAQRQNKGEINTKQGRIEQVVFQIPEGKQVIVLDFADERMPGGLFLYGANTQEETICYHSSTYGALIDFKYNLFDGGFLIPEFGCLYIKDTVFYKPEQHTENRNVDIIAAACYDITGEHGLHRAPSTLEEVEANTKKKLETVIAAAQANSTGNGANTYLIIGPIGCGAFQNSLDTITKLWAEILSKPLDEARNTQQRHAFEHIWFLSGKQDKLDVFERACTDIFRSNIVKRA